MPDAKRDEDKSINIYRAWCDLKPGVSDTAFVDGVAKYIDHLRSKGLIEGRRPTRRKLDLGPESLGEFHLTMEARDLVQRDRAFEHVAARSEPVEGFHFGVNSLVQNERALVRLVPVIGGAGLDL